MNLLGGLRAVHARQQHRVSLAAEMVVAGPTRHALLPTNVDSFFRAACLVALVTAGTAAAQAEVELAQIQRDAAVVDAEMTRIDLQYQNIPDLFSMGDRDDRALWGAIHHLNKEYQRASLALFGAVEPREGESLADLEATPDYAESLFFLADSLYELGNIGAASRYFEKLLKLKSKDYKDDAILRLMTIANNDRRYDAVDAYYSAYLAFAGSNVPGQVRYLRAKSLFRSARDDAAIEELTKVRSGDAFDLRARYLKASILTRQGKLSDALTIFDAIILLKNVAREDGAVKEMTHLGRGRLLYELDRLDESIDAYQSVEFDSKYLTMMLYELTLTHVRLGQLALADNKDGLTSKAERAEAAGVEYKKALRQIDDLRALDPDGERAADIDLLAGNLRLQRQDFDQADGIFAEVLEKHRTADLELQRLLLDSSLSDMLMRDILALENDPHALLESPLPVIVANRAARSTDVNASLTVFKDIQKSRADVESAQRLLEQLEENLSADNRARAELFRPLQSAVERSVALTNTVIQITSRALSVERKQARLSRDLATKVDEINQRRTEIEALVRQLPKTPEAIAKRKKRFIDRIDAIDRDTHELELISANIRATLASVDWLSRRELEPGPRAKLQADVVQMQAQLVANDEVAANLRRRVVEVRRGLQTIGGRGSSEDLLRSQWSSLAAEEFKLLRAARDPSQLALLSRVDATLDKLASATARNSEFRDRLERTVEERLKGARAMIAEERTSLAGYAGTLAEIDLRAAGLRDAATAVALERVRSELTGIVLRADVGVVDTAFGRKQAETERISALQKARAAELTDLTQAYADLTRDELP